MMFLFRLPTPTRDIAKSLRESPTPTITFKEFSDSFKIRRKEAKEKNKLFGWGLKRYEMALDEKGELWLVGLK